MQNRMRKETLNNPIIIVADIANPMDQTIHYLNTELRQFWNERHLPTEVNSIVLRENEIVISPKSRSDIIEGGYEGHLGIADTKRRARQVVWWPGMGVQMETVVAHCDF